MPEAIKTIKGSATQDFVAIDEIREDIIILKNRGLRAVLMCGSRNLELESIDSQNAVISAYADFVNSFDWPVQIIVHSRKLDINPYLSTLAEKLKTQENELLKIQTAEYIDFIKNFVTLTDIMIKRFYISIPFDSIESKTEGPIEKITSLLPARQQKNTLTEEKSVSYTHLTLPTTPYV